MNRMLKIHFVSLVIALMDLMLFCGAGISFRGQLLDVIVAGLPIVTAFILMLGYFRVLSLGLKIYSSIACIISIIMSPVYILMSIPLKVYLEHGGYELRQSRGFLGPPSVDIEHKTFIFETDIAHSVPVYFVQSSDLVPEMHFVFKPDSIGIFIPNENNQDTILYFRK